MELIIAILLWMQTMVGGGQYTQAQYQQMLQSNEATINQVLADPACQAVVMDQYGMVAPTVVVGEED